MKKKLVLALFSIVTILTSIQAQKAENGKIIITGSRFAYPLLERWISEFKTKYPEVEFRVIPRGGANTDSANLIINAHTLAPEEIRPEYTVVDIARYAILVVANAKNPLLKNLENTGIKEKQLKALYFKKYDPLATKENAPKKTDKEAYKPVLYTRLEKACAPTTFARNFGFEQDDILGKKIGGDDKYLITAIERDTNGITYNNLGFIYNLKTREIKPGLAALPVDINGNGKLDEDEKFYTSLDDVIARLEKKNIAAITTGSINISYPAKTDETNKNLSLFLNWVLESGQQYNHEFGFLNFEKDQLTEQKAILAHSLN